VPRRRFRRRDVAAFTSQLEQSPLFNDWLSVAEAIGEMAPTIEKLLTDGNTLDTIAEGIAQLGMMPAATFKRAWTAFKQSHSSAQVEAKSAELHPDSPPKPEMPRVAAPAEPGATIEQGVTTSRSAPLQEPPSRTSGRRVLIPADGKFD
jgi:hypothetical protein